jgi:chromosome partitioning protein
MRHVIFNSKGGVGKSSIVCNLAAVSAVEGKRTLVVDLDPQANASHYLLGPGAGETKPNLTDFFEETLSLRLLTSSAEAWVHPTPFERLSILPADPGLAELQPKLETRYKIYKLKKLLDELTAFDTIFLDTPPALNFFTTSALISADNCLIPFDCDEFSRRALLQLLATVEEIREDHNSGLEIGGIIVNLFQMRARLPRQLVDGLLQESLPVLEPYITASVKMRESHEAHRPLVYLAPSHKLSQQFRELHATLDHPRRTTVS